MRKLTVNKDTARFMWLYGNYTYSGIFESNFESNIYVQCNRVHQVLPGQPIDRDYFITELIINNRGNI